MRNRIKQRLLVTIVATSLVVTAVPAHAAPGAGSANMRHVTTLRYELRYGQDIPSGTDIEFARIAGREYAFAGTYRNASRSSISRRRESHD